MRRRARSPGHACDPVAALNQLTDRGHTDGICTRVDTPLANAIGRAMAGRHQAVAPAAPLRQLRTHLIILADPGYRDCLAHNASVARVQRRMRIYRTD